ncbi:hypothetical protein BH09PSE2_BH09PSE2_08120 [soil metagenome]
MPTDLDADDQDQSEAFDETLTEGDDNFGEPTNADVKPDTYDATYALGDGDTDDESGEADAADRDDDALAEMEGDADEDDLDDDNAEVGPLAVDNIVDFTSDRDFPSRDDLDGVAAHSADEAEVISMGDANDLAALESGQTLAELEPDDVSDEELKSLGYKD